MAEFEELRLTVNLVDNASSGLQRLRAGLGDLTKSTDAMTQSLTTGVAAVNNLGTASTAAAPHVRSIGQASRDAARSAHELKDGFMRMNVATQGLSSLPAIAGNVRDLGFAVHGLGTAFSLVGTAASVAVIGIAAVAVAVVGLGAVVVAYGVSVFKFASEMEQLGRTAKQMGLGFASLKYATDQAKQFGYSADMVIRSYQGIQAAQLDLYKNNSQLRATLLGQGVDAGWIAQLSKLDPNQARSAIIRYSKQLEAQALASGAMKGNARRLMAQFLKEFGLTVADADMPELKPPSPEKRAQLEEIDRYSKLIKGVWNQMTFEWTKFKTELLATNLPILRDSLIGLKGKMPAILKELKIWIEYAVSFLPGLVGKIPIVVKKVGVALKGVISLFQGVITALKYITSPWKTLKSRAHPALQKLMGWDEFMSAANEEAWAERRRQGNYSMWDKEMWGGGTPTDEALRNQGLEPIRPEDIPAPAPPPTPPPGAYGPRQSGPWVPPHQLRQNMSYNGGANDNSNPLLVRASFTQNELKDEIGSASEETSKLTRQIEKLNDYIERAEGKTQGQGGDAAGYTGTPIFRRGVGGGVGGGGNVFGGGSGGGGSGSGGTDYSGGGGSHSGGGGTSAPGGPAQLTDQTGKGIDPETMKQVEKLGRAGDSKGLEQLFAAKGYRMSGPACGMVASKYVMSAGFKPPQGGAIATNWHNWGEQGSASDINKEGHPFGSMVATYFHRRYGGDRSQLLRAGDTGGHVMNIVPGTYDAKSNTAMFADQYGVHRRNLNDMDVRYAGDKAVAEAASKRDGGGGNDSAKVPGLDSSSKTSTSTGDNFTGEANSRLMGAVKQIESGGDPNAVTGSYKGLYQLSETEFRKYGGKGSIFDPAENTRVAELKLADEGKELSAKLGRPVSEAEVYMAHQQGVGGATQHLQNPDRPAWQSMYATAEGRQKGEGWAKKAIWGNMSKAMKSRYGSVENVTSGDFTGEWRERYARAAGYRTYADFAKATGGATTSAEASKADTPVAANSNIPELKGEPGGAARPGPTVERAALLDRKSLTDSNEVQTDGKLKADVTAPPGTKVEVTGSGAFKNTETSKSTTVSQSKESESLAI
jgi:hypothetical protein